MDQSYDFFVPTARGLERVLETELDGLGLKSIHQGVGGVFFRGTLPDAYKANLWLRTGNRVLLVLKEFTCKDPDALYKTCRSMPWDRYLLKGQTFAVDASTWDTPLLKNAQYAALKVKDAVADALRSKWGHRPDVDRHDPDLGVSLHVVQGKATLSLDTTGDRLHRRGYGSDRKKAPLKETLAAGLVLLSGWDGRTPLIDPMCGTGTIVIEAALFAAHRAPGLLHERFAFEKWRNFQQSAWKELVREAQQTGSDAVSCPIVGMDKDWSAVQSARRNAKKAGVENYVRFLRRDVLDFEPETGPGLILTNPPYGHRLDLPEDPQLFYKKLGDVLKHKCNGWTAEIFTGDPNLAKQIELRTSRRIILYNGPPECRLLRYEMH
ncbi:MAG: methyltransferase [Deltaproteobacteria bacterium]|nr:methyltransferase [Deltaproteobacteria bacterium]